MSGGVIKDAIESLWSLVALLSATLVAMGVAGLFKNKPKTKRQYKRRISRKG
jgi:hypothetical protein